MKSLFVLDAIVVVVYGLKNAPKSVTVDGKSAEFSAIEHDAYVITVGEGFEKIEVKY